jgi:signal transduction histidine kinase
VNDASGVQELRLRKKLILLFLFFSIVPLTAISIAAYITGKDLIHDAVVSHLQSITRSKSRTVEAFMDERVSDLQLLADMASNGNLKGDDTILKQMRDIMARYRVYKRLEIVNGNMNVQIAVGLESIAGDCGYRQTCLSEALIGRQYKGDIFLSSQTEEPALAICIPIREESRRVDKAVIGYVSFKQVGERLRTFEVGQTGEAYLIDTQGYFLTRTRLGGQLLKETIPEESRNIYLGASGTGEYIDYRGKLVLGASKRIPDTKWILVAEQDSEEAFAEIRSFGFTILLIWSIVLVLVIATTFAISNAVYAGLRARYMQILDLKAYSDSIVSMLPMAVLVLDKELGIISANKIFRQTFEVNEEDIRNKKLKELLGSPQLLGGLRKTAQTGAAFDEKAIQIGLGEEMGYFNAKASALYLGEKTQVLLVLNNVTEHMHTQEQMQKAERLSSLGILTAGVAHELNTPLANMLLYTQMALEEAGESNGELIGNLKAVEEEARRGASIVKELLEFSRQSDLETDVADVNEILANLLSLVKSQCALSKIKIEKNLDYSLPRIKTDLGRLQQVFMNIVANAMWAMPDGGTVTVRTDYDREHQAVKISISDTGIGIMQENIGRIFDPFFTTKRPGEGTGLGLSVSHGIIKKMGGEILVESRTADQKSPEPNQPTGTTFIVELPIGDITVA